MYAFDRFFQKRPIGGLRTQNMYWERQSFCNLRSPELRIPMVMSDRWIQNRARIGDGFKGGGGAAASYWLRIVFIKWPFPVYKTDRSCSSLCAFTINDDVADTCLPRSPAECRQTVFGEFQARNLASGSRSFSRYETSNCSINKHRGIA